MEGARPSVGSCELPTGVVIDGKLAREVLFRELAGPEEEILAARKMMASKKFTQVMINCIQRFGDFDTKDVISRAVRSMTILDRMYFLLQLRMISVGEIFSFEYPCPACGNKDKLAYDLNKIIVKGAPDASNLFREVKLPSGQVVRLRAANSDSEEQIERASNEANAITIALFSRIDSLNERPPALVDVAQLTMRDRNAIRKAIDELEGEIDDTFEADCPKCGEHYSGSIPIGSPDFFFQ